MTKDASVASAKLLLTWLKGTANLHLKPEEIAQSFAQRFNFPTSISIRSIPQKGGSTSQRMTVKIGARIFEYKRVFKKSFGQTQTIVAWNSTANWPA